MDTKCPHCNEDLFIPVGFDSFTCHYCNKTFTVMSVLGKSAGENLRKMIPPFQEDDKEILSPKHYEQFKIQVMEFCQVNNIGWCASNVIKYVCRENMKNGLEDLKKARQYLDCLIHYKETGEFFTPDKLQGKEK